MAGRKSVGGRPTKYSPHLHRRIVLALRQGAYVETAAAAAGINKTTLYDWLKRGARGEEPFATFSADIEAAQADAELRDVKLVGEAAKTDWRAAAWRLERKFPKRYGLQSRHEVSTPEGELPPHVTIVYPARGDGSES